MSLQIDDMDFYALRAALDWQVDLGVDEAVQDTPVNRYEVPPATPVQPIPPVAPASAQSPAIAAQDAQAEAVAAAQQQADAAQDIAALHAAMQAYGHCELERGARNLVFSTGQAGARVMVITAAPSRDEDREGQLLTGPAGALFDKMFAAIGLQRDAQETAQAVYAAPVVPWRTPSDRDPTDLELAQMQPFLARHIALAAPDVLVAMGAAACHALTARAGLTRLRGTWAQAHGLPVMPMFDAAHLLKNPAAKREAWADLLALQAKLREAEV